jgi:ribosomal protein S12 methylthiotransferase
MLAKIRATIPGATLRTSMIVGFPGETEDDFKALLDFVAAAEFDHLGVFLYSNEETSGSFALADQVAARVARQRQKKLMARQQKISRRRLRRLVGQSLPVLVEGRSPETELLFLGRLESQAPEIDGQILINDYQGAEPRAGEFRWATITESHDYDLVAQLEDRYFAEPVAAAARTAAPRLVQIQPVNAAPQEDAYALPHL